MILLWSIGNLVEIPCHVLQIFMVRLEVAFVLDLCSAHLSDCIDPRNSGISVKCKNIMFKMQTATTCLSTCYNMLQPASKTIRKKNTMTKMRCSAKKQTCLHKRLSWPCASSAQKVQQQATCNWNSRHSTLLPIFLFFLEFLPFCLVPVSVHLDVVLILVFW